MSNFNTENEFCTLRFSLFEGRERTKVTFFTRVKVALEWTLEYYALALVVVAGIAVCSLLLLLIVDRLKILSAVVSRSKE